MIKKIDLNIWDRDFTLDVVYECYSYEKVTTVQEKALIDFLKNVNVIDKAKKIVEKYCEESVNADEENNKKDNIFSYIKPHYIFVKRGDSQKVAVMCKYKYDMENGIAIVFEKDEKIIVCVQDEIL